MKKVCGDLIRLLEFASILYLYIFDVFITLSIQFLFGKKYPHICYIFCIDNNFCETLQIKYVGTELR